MGMFDNVDYKYDCKECGTELTDFQSKDGDCNLLTITPDKVSYFYTTCNKCGSWHDFEVIKACIVQEIIVTNLPPKIKLDK